jgi:two-component system sensor histidine kinase HydH
MTATLAHEIRNSLGSLKGYVQLVEGRLDPGDVEKRQWLSVALRGVARIEGLVGEMLLFSREERYHLVPLELGALAEETARQETVGWSGEVRFRVDRGVVAVADREKVERVLRNVVRNALEAMGDGGTLDVRVRRDGSFAVASVEDSGPGVAEEEERLFTPFHTSKVDGTGLGLAYSRKVVEGMGGSVSLGNREGRRGAVLTVRLPGGG